MAGKKPTDGVSIAAMKKIIALLKQRHEEDGALIEELDRLAGGGKGIGTILTECYNEWDQLWSTEHGGTYVFDFKKDAPNMKRLIRLLGQDELYARFFNYMRDRGEYLMKAKHPFALFVSQNNRYASNLNAATQAGFEAVGCTHTPRCKSDVEHTAKRASELQLS